MILFLSKQVPHPPDIGLRIRQRHLLEALANVAPVQLVFGYDRDEDLEHAAALEPLCEKIHAVPTDWRQRRTIQPAVPVGDGLRETHTLLPFRSRLVYSRALQRVAREVAAQCRLVHVERLPMAAHLQALIDDPRREQWMILDVDDVESDIVRGLRSLEPPTSWRKRITDRIDLAVLRRYQRRTLRGFDHLLVASEKDRQRLGGGPELCVVPNGADIARGPLPAESDGATLLLLGTWGYAPNVDALHYFLAEILPLVRREIPEVRLLVVGRDMPAAVSALDDGDRVEVAADVPDVEPYYRRATVSVVPLRVGAGTRIKILEAFALGTPVVSTSVGCEGLEAEPDVHLLVADDPAAFARSCVRLLRDAELRRTLALRARRFVERHYGWDAIRNRLAELATRLLAEPRRAP